MNKMFDSFYFLHIQKTGGRSYMDNILNPIKKTLLDSKIMLLNRERNGSDHNQWIDEITDLTYITSTFRDSCKQVVSLYVHNKIYKLENNINKEDFLKWFKNNEIFLTNFQSKNMILHPNYKVYEVNCSNMTKEDILNKISKISLFFKPEILQEKNQLTIQNKILSDLQITNAKFKNYKWQENRYKNFQSKEIYESLTKKEKNYIKTVNFIDSEIYETDSLFWKI
jgi:hypothetical protein